MKTLNKLMDTLGRIPNDKLLHFIFGILIFSFVLSIMKLLVQDPCVQKATALGTVFLIGTLKELWYDIKNDRSAEMADAGATYLGGFVGLIIYLIT